MQGRAGAVTAGATSGVLNVLAGTSGPPQRLCRKAGLPDAVTPHSLRHSYATESQKLTPARTWTLGVSQLASDVLPRVIEDDATSAPRDVREGPRGRD